MKLKNSISLVLVLFLFACTATPKTPLGKTEPKPRPHEHLQFVIRLEDDELAKVSFGEDYEFELPAGFTYNKVFVNEQELEPTKENTYLIQDIQEDITITFNKQYEITLDTGEGYELNITSNHSLIVNEHDSVAFRLDLEDNYNKSSPIVIVNNESVPLTNNTFTVADIQSNVVITVENVTLNVTEPEQKPEPTDYSQYVNTDLSWWYRYPSPLNSGVKPTIDSGIANLISRHNGYWLIPTNQKVVYLTMDEGYEYQNNTTEILAIAREKNVKITFFITGGYLDSNPALVQAMVRDGHIVANHTDKHLRAATALNTSNQTFINDIKTLETKYRNLTGRNIASLYRPPEGGYSERSLAIAKDLGYRTIFWSFAYRDWLVDDQPDLNEAYDKIMSQLHPGAIILLHAVSDTNVALLPKLIEDIRAQGYTIGSLQ